MAAARYAKAGGAALHSRSSRPCLVPNGTPYGIRTRVAGVRGRCPRPLDERGRKREMVPPGGQWPKSADVG